MEITIGQFALPAILTVVLALIYQLIPKIPNRAKPAIAVGCGMGLGFVGVIYAGVEMTGKVVIDYLLAGFMAGAAAVGLYEFQSKVRNTKAKTKGAGGNTPQSTKLHNIGIIFLALAILSGGCFGAIGVKPWAERTPVEKSAFFMDFYKGQYNDTMNLATQLDLTDAQKEVVREKKKLLYKLKKYVTMYDDYAKGGLTAPDDLEQKILNLINRLATL